ncbi:MAG: M3 family metallopeptidase, partial [Bacteroidota bacterium]|nr:M3 family metallopeptidase [Bacteroidota bacterium]
MRKIILLLMVAVMIGACNTAPEKIENPFFTEYDTPFKIPPFGKIKNEHYIPAFEKGIEEHKAEIEAIVNNQEEPTFKNTIVAMSECGDILNKVSSVFYAQNGSNTNEELQKIAEQVSPMLSAHYDEISLNAKLFKRVKAIYAKKDELNLTEEQAYILENKYKGFERSGANLSKEQQEKLKSINSQLSSLTLKFSQNVLAETNSFKMVVADEKDLAGLSESSIKAAAETAKEEGMEGKWVFTTQKTSMIPFLQYAENRDLREKIYTAYLNRGNNNNENDNKEILSNIVKLRYQKASLLGFKNYADYRLEPRMAKKAENVMQLLGEIWSHALPLAKKEAKEMQKMINKEGGEFELASWDWWYYAEKIRKAKYDLDENELRPYFKLENVREGAFLVANKLYGITFEEIHDVPTIHP